MKNLFAVVILFMFLLYVVPIQAQLIDNTSTFRNLSNPKYFRFHYDNDYFTKTDKYYSQGITFEYVHPNVKKFFVTKLLWKPFTTVPQYGLTFNLFGYTPTTIESDEILLGDRPFDANMSFKTFSIQADAIHKQQLATAFSVGVMGKAALGYDIQYNLHRLFKNILPHGWQHQIKNDVIINYQLNYEKKLLGNNKNFLLNGTAEARIGTLHDRISGGFNFMAGRFNKRFGAGNNDNRKAEYYLYGQSRVNLIGYDATMQGGLFNKTSPYTIAGEDISRVTFQADAGVIVNFKNFYLSYTQSFLSKEFRTGTYHRWGGISIGVGL